MNMNAYVSVWRLRFINGLQYRAAAAAGMVTQLFFGLIFIMIFAAFYSFNSASAPMSIEEIVTYVWLQQIFLALTMLWFWDFEIFNLITSGGIAYELCRPAGLYPLWYAKILAQNVSRAVLRCSPIAIIAFLLPEPYRIGMPQSGAALVLFVITLLLGMLLVVAIVMLICISVFWTMSPTGSVLMISVAGEFLSGKIIPVPLMPDWLQKIAYVLPFRWTADFPFRVYSGHIGTQEALLGIVIQLLWLAALILFGQWLIRRALRSVVIQGG